MTPKQMTGLIFVGLISAAYFITFNSKLASGGSSLHLIALRHSVLAEHNVYRSTHHASALTTSNSLNKSAQKWANHLAAKNIFEHSDNTQVGENIYVLYGQRPLVEARTLAQDAVKFWYSEVANYNYSKPGFSENTGHFTQVIWKKTTQLGCGAARGTSVSEPALYVVCQYNPAGNESKQFAINVLKP